MAETETETDADADAETDVPAPRAGVPVGASVLRGILAFAVYQAAWLIDGALALVVHPGWARLGQKGMDPNFYVWGLRWWPYALAHGLDPMHTALVQAPHGVNLAWITTVPPLAVLAWPITSAFGPVVTFNLLVAVALPVSGWAAYLVCHRITRRFWASLAGGAVYGFSSYELNHIAMGHLNLAFAPILPLIAYLVLLWLDKKIRSWLLVGLLALAMAAQFYLFLETYADLTVVMAVALLAGYVLAGRDRRPLVARLSRLAGLAYLLSLVLAAPFAWSALTHVPAGFMRPPGLPLDVAGLVVSRSGNALGLNWLGPHGTPGWPRGCFVGLPLLAFAEVFAIARWSSRIARFLTVMLAFVLVAALGPTVQVYGKPRFTLPWAPLFYLPIVRSSFPSRLMVFAFLALAVMIAIWLATPTGWPWLRWLVAIVAIATCVTCASAPKARPAPGVPVFIRTGQYRHDLARGSTVVVIATHTGNAGLLWQAETDFYFRLAGGYLNEAIARSPIPAPVARLLDAGSTPANIAGFRSYVKTARVSAILVADGSAPWWSVIFARLGMKPDHVGGVSLFRTSQLTGTGSRRG